MIVRLYLTSSHTTFASSPVASRSLLPLLCVFGFSGITILAVNCRAIFQSYHHLSLQEKQRRRHAPPLKIQPGGTQTTTCSFENVETFVWSNDLDESFARDTWLVPLRSDDWLNLARAFHCSSIKIHQMLWAHREEDRINRLSMSLLESEQYRSLRLVCNFAFIWLLPSATTFPSNTSPSGGQSYQNYILHIYIIYNPQASLINVIRRAKGKLSKINTQTVRSTSATAILVQYWPAALSSSQLCFSVPTTKLFVFMMIVSPLSLPFPLDWFFGNAAMLWDLSKYFSDYNVIITKPLRCNTIQFKM